MTTTTKNRRSIQRHPASETSGARVEFSWPHPNGENQSLSLVDISGHVGRGVRSARRPVGWFGLSFAFGENLPGLTTGTEVEGVTLRFAGCDVRGKMVVLRVTAEPTGMSCAVMFYPASDEERFKLKNIIAGMELLQST